MGNIVHVVGTGTIGEPLVGLLCDMKHQLGIDEVTFYKHSPVLTDRPKVKGLLNRGGKLVVDKEKIKDFRELDLEPEYTAEEAIERATVVVDCTPKGIGLQNKEKFYKKYEDKVKGFAIKTVAMRESADNFVSGRFVCIRRTNDISQSSGFVPSPEVGTHNDERGTHHARDVWHLYNTLGLDLDVFSSAMKVNTQYMHAIWFDIAVKKETSTEEIIDNFINEPRVAVTNKKLANLVFSFGRDHGHYGRILNQTVAVLPTIFVRNKHEVVGFCFTPQDGNSLLSSVTAVEHLLYPDEYKERIGVLSPFLFDEV